MGTPRRTPTPSQGSRFGAVSGFLLKLLREAAGLTQGEFAELVGVDISTVGSWESGRRPLANLRAGDLTRLRMQLIRHGAPSHAIALVDDALHADLIIGDTLATDPGSIGVEDHPLAVSIHQRTLANLIAADNAVCPDRGVHHCLHSLESARLRPAGSRVAGSAKRSLTAGIS